ncbi:aldehyde dehydrogenase family protein [Rhodococcus sp. IEGM 1381]|uniref:aldehyde dehydrogenase family protein n=1 Tax=Rhodococcus sp. IEGM 1381 TaxID=3047085 RepID=UPI0024B77813|nr:aldehyde dehydrogenase family protein [Rhodococcus sp. IEGM 1381]MDI9893112.1 aldehyde dehydrogenase family protein [Rhodococcus sp. IEGM 1381]
MTDQIERTTVSTFESLDPRTGVALATYPIADATEVEAVVARARSAARWWDTQGFAGRKRWLLEFKSAIARDAASLAAVIAAETGKPDEDSLLEVMLGVEHIDWAARNAEKTLRQRKVGSGLLAVNQKAYVGYRPFGVVGVIGPWNYPLYTPMGSIAYALAAGNTVVFKPSELTPGVGVWLAEKWASLAAAHPVFQTVTGDGSTGTALVESGVDKIAFTGSTATAKKVMATCAKSLTPLIAECGGKDAMLIDSDADIAAAVEFATFGAMGNAGQTCAGVERIYVAAPVYDRFVAEFTTAVRALKPGGTKTSSYGPMTLGKQSEIVRGQIEDALARGGKAVVGGLESLHGPYIDPVILTDVPEDSTAITEETFGPTVVVNRVRDLDEAIERANASKYGLGTSVFTQDEAVGRRAAEKLDCGVVTVNSVLGFAGVPALPFGGTGDSGFGRIHGADGLREFSTVKSMTVQSFAAPVNLLTMKRKARNMKLSVLALKLRHGRG